MTQINEKPAPSSVEEAVERLEELASQERVLGGYGFFFIVADVPSCEAGILSNLERRLAVSLLRAAADRLEQEEKADA